MRRVRPVAPLALVCLALAACSAAPRTESAGEAASPIINGKNSDDSQNAVVLLVYPVSSTEAFECTGTMLAPNLILTARHCVSKTADAAFGCDEKGNGTAGGTVGQDYVASNLLVFTGTKRPLDPFNGKSDAKGVKIFHDDAKNLCNHDLALLLLDRKIDAKPIAPVRLEAPATKGEMFTAVGWGITSTTDSPPVRQQRAGVRIEFVGPNVDATTGLAVGPNEFQVGESICQGDSGGPALDTATGAILGVVSRGGNGQAPTPSDPAFTCRSGENFYTMTSGFKTVILAAYAEAGQDPWIEGGPDPRLAKLGEPCAAAEACRSSLCLTDTAGAPTTCTQSCATDACPEGYVCSTQGSAKLCTVPPPPAAPGKASPGKGGTTTTTSCSVSRSGSDTAIAGWGLLGVGMFWATRRRRSV